MGWVGAAGEKLRCSRVVPRRGEVVDRRRFCSLGQLRSPIVHRIARIHHRRHRQRRSVKLTPVVYETSHQVADALPA